ncbi:DNA polymerase [Caudoviricetes sp.]|nr:DNA polymerase [Caudoviricetes sp.]UOF79107.1 DNA polymerase [Caudoviricetes sp.]
MIAAVDIETSCNVKGCPGQGHSNKCDHAVHHKLNKIDLIGVYDGIEYFCFRSVDDFDKWYSNYSGDIIGHGFKFDFKVLKAKGSKIELRRVVGDTQLLGSVVRRKVPESYLAMYSEKRKELNAKLPDKVRHRMGTPLSLKVMAPFYLKIAPFWENPETHDDPEYNKKDCIYTHQLHAHLINEAEKDNTLKFYREKLLMWNKLLTQMELEGVLIDEPLLHSMYAAALKDAATLEEVVHKELTEYFKDYIALEAEELVNDSQTKCKAFIDKLKDPGKAEGTKVRYAAALQKKIDKLPKRFNLNSNDQVKYILDKAGIDMVVDKKDKETNEWIEKEGADKYVLKRTKVRTKSELASKLLAYREKQTEVRYLKQYIEAVVGGRIYSGFNITGTRTGRLSSSGPNLQNVKGVLRHPFIIAQPDLYSIYTVDASQIEPRIVAFLTADKEMVELFKAGRDYHNYATKKFFPEATSGVKEEDIKHHHSTLRKTAKIGDLSIIYGTGASTFSNMCLLREEMDIPPHEAKDMVSSFRQGMKGVFEWKKDLEESYKAGNNIHNMFGRLVAARNDSIHMTLFNSLVQGTASDMIVNAAYMAYLEFYKRKIDSFPLALVHDEAIWRFEKGKEELSKKIVDFYMCHYLLNTQHGDVPLSCEGNLSSRWEK